MKTVPTPFNHLMHIPYSHNLHIVHLARPSTVPSARGICRLTGNLSLLSVCILSSTARRKRSKVSIVSTNTQISEFWIEPQQIQVPVSTETLIPLCQRCRTLRSVQHSLSSWAIAPATSGFSNFHEAKQQRVKRTFSYPCFFHFAIKIGSA